ncbi:MAG: TetR/AcrR family transcriptional regulator [Ignavibacteriaceae bacterium]|jgi:AcrR family transcriptional regulator|nr:TetR/AcrR family transcriptional regulator [Ignavibacteriaceae bacterium]
MPNERKAQIIKAAAKRFARHGLAKTTLDEVARDIRIGKATIYHYFTSKDELYFTTLKWECENFIDTVKSVLTAENEQLITKLNNYISLKGTISETNKLIHESFINFLNDRSFDPEKEIIGWLLTKETELIKQFLTNHYSQRIKKVSSAFPTFIVLNSWGMFFSNNLGTLIERDRSAEIKKIFIESLEVLLN